MRFPPPNLGAALLRLNCFDLFEGDLWGELRRLTFVSKILTYLGMMIIFLATWMITVCREYFVSLK